MHDCQAVLINKKLPEEERKLKICIETHVEKFTDSKNAIPFDLQRKVTKLSRTENRFRTMASPGACGVFSTSQFNNEA